MKGILQIPISGSDTQVPEDGRRSPVPSTVHLVFCRIQRTDLLRGQIDPKNLACKSRSRHWSFPFLIAFAYSKEFAHFQLESLQLRVLEGVLTTNNQMNIIVAGGTNNNYYSIGGFRYLQSVQIDKWL